MIVKVQANRRWQAVIDGKPQAAGFGSRRHPLGDGI